MMRATLASVILFLAAQGAALSAPPAAAPAKTAALPPASPAAAPAKKGQPGFMPGGNSKEPTTINAAKLDYFEKEKKLIYSGGVEATNGDSRLKCSTLVIYLAKAPEGAAPAAKSDGPASSGTSVDKAECLGPVTVVSKEDVGTGDNGLYDKPANKFFITGHVQLSQGSNVITGDKLTYDMATSQANVTGNVKSLFLPGSKPDTGKPKEPKKPKG